jgi:hypothetical protein
MTLLFRRYADGLSLEKAAPTTWQLSEFWVANARDEGILEMSLGNIVIHLREGDLIYRVLEEPGVYEDEEEPAGYRISHEYDCELVTQPPTHTGNA